MIKGNTTMPPKVPKQPRGPKGQFISRKSLTNPSDTSSVNTSTESSPLDTPELRNTETEDQLTDWESSENELHEVHKQLEQIDEEDQESLAGAPDPETNILPTFDNQPITTIDIAQPQVPIAPWPAPPNTPIQEYPGALVECNDGPWRMRTGHANRMRRILGRRAVAYVKA
jgi:hypothetical protein